MKNTLQLVLLAVLSSAPLSVSSETNIALQIDADNAAELIQGGPDAIGGIDDWFLSNGTLCAIISDVEHEGEFSTKGGALVDLGYCDRNDDHYTQNQDLVDGKRTRPLNSYSISAKSSDTNARVTVLSKENGIELSTQY
ncbi:MAG: hypothetical protein AAF197_12260, partial [Pseudomonadota bacterium]